MYPRPIPPNAKAEITQISASTRIEPRIGTLNASTPNPRSVITSRIKKNSLEKRNDSRYSARDIGVAILFLRDALVRRLAENSEGAGMGILHREARILIGLFARQAEVEFEWGIVRAHQVEEARHVRPDILV